MADQDSTNLRYPRIWVHDDCPGDLVTASRTLAANQPCAEYVRADIADEDARQRDELLAVLERIVQPNLTARLETYNAARAAIAECKVRNTR